MQWKAIETATDEEFADGLGARYGHTALALDGARVLVLGGKTAAKSDPSDWMPLWLLDLESKEWTLRTVEGPRVRWGHCTARLEQGVLLFGGLNSTYNLGDVWTLDLDKWAWQAHNLVHSPSVRGYASAVATRSSARESGPLDACLTFGGLWCHGGPYEYNNELVLLEPDSGRASRPRASGAPPAPRAQHAAVSSSALGARHMLVVGGCDNQMLFTDVYALCLHEWSWSRLQCSGPPPLLPMELRPRDFRITPLRPCAVAARGHLLLLSERERRTQLHALRLEKGGAEACWRPVECGEAPRWRQNGAAVWAGSELLHVGGSQRDFVKLDCICFGPAVRWPQLRLLFIGLQDPSSQLRVLPALLLQRVVEFLNPATAFVEDAA